MTEHFLLLSIIIMIQQLLVEVKMAYVDQQSDDQRSRTNVFNPGYQAIKIGECIFHYNQSLNSWRSNTEMLSLFIDFLIFYFSM